MFIKYGEGFNGNGKLENRSIETLKWVKSDFEVLSTERRNISSDLAQPWQWKPIAACLCRYNSRCCIWSNWQIFFELFEKFLQHTFRRADFSSSCLNYKYLIYYLVNFFVRSLNLNFKRKYRKCCCLNGQTIYRASVFYKLQDWFIDACRHLQIRRNFPPRTSSSVRF